MILIVNEMVEDMISRTTRRLKNLTPQLPTLTSAGAGNLISQAIVDGGAGQEGPPVEINVGPPVEARVNVDDITVQTGLVESRTSDDTNDVTTVPTTSLEGNEVSGIADGDVPNHDVYRQNTWWFLGNPEVVNFTDILSKVPRVEEDGYLVINKNAITSATDKSDEDKLLDKIMQASKAGDRETADLLCRLYGKLASSTSLAPPTNLSQTRSVSSDASLPGHQSIKPVTKALVFVSGALAGHMEIGFTPFFDKALRNLHGIIPLTIFDKAWQEKCMSNHMFADKKKSEEKNGEYVGYSYPNEWTQSYAKWNGNHRNFLITIRDVYKHDGFVPWLIAHKANVDQIVSDCGFLTGFRYDILVRQNAFAFPVPQPDGSQSVADISVLRTDIEDKVYELTRRLDELEYADNPYAYNCQKYNWDPHTGKPKSNKNKMFDNTGGYDSNGGNRGRGYRGKGEWGGRNDQNGSEYGTPNNDHSGWNNTGGDNGWGQKRKADTSAWGSGNGGYRNNDYNRNTGNPSTGLSQGAPRYINKKDGNAKSNPSGKDTNV
ncbi:hypothetical protein PSTT_15374 [Puccinia striiformis]|uniref:Uncharacterized protein n=3 Tax=Puccinia striiformis TaxID=27350 RepID=A0A2S4UI63_9BASI|nr:hypothetical protein PSTT_15374 [Puccinia striiformis]